MVNRYPDIIKFKTVPSDSVYDQNTGEWSEPGVSVELELKCRAEMNGTGKTVASNDGESLEYAYTVYLERSVPVFKFGQSVEVFNVDGLLISSSVKKFNRGQFNARLWV